MVVLISPLATAAVGGLECATNGGLDFPVDGGLDLAADKVSGLRIGMDLGAGLEKRGGGGGQISVLVGTQGNMGGRSIGQVCGGSRRGVNWRIGRAG